MMNEPSESELACLPQIGHSQALPARNRMIYLHFYMNPNTDWYIAEYDEGYRRMFGFVVLDGQIEAGRWGFVDFDDLLTFRDANGREVEHDSAWSSKQAAHVKRILEAYSAQHLRL